MNVQEELYLYHRDFITERIIEAINKKYEEDYFTEKRNRLGLARLSDHEIFQVFSDNLKVLGMRIKDRILISLDLIDFYSHQKKQPFVDLFTRVISHEYIHHCLSKLTKEIIKKDNKIIGEYTGKQISYNLDNIYKEVDI